MRKVFLGVIIGSALLAGGCVDKNNIENVLLQKYGENWTSLNTEDLLDEIEDIYGEEWEEVLDKEFEKIEELIENKYGENWEEELEKIFEKYDD